MGYKIRKGTDEGCCLECGTTFYGRKDKKFCSLGCKNNYNNRRIRNIHRYRSEVLSRLGKNYSILESMLMDKMDSAPLERLKELGFEDTFLTGHRMKRRKHEECSCFDISYCKTGSRIFGVKRLELPESITDNDRKWAPNRGRNENAAGNERTD